MAMRRSFISCAAIGKQIHMIKVKGGEEKLTCCGDEPFNPYEETYAKDSKWLLHKAFCLYGQTDKYQPYKKHHSTVKDACELAETLHIRNLILYHTEDDTLKNRKAPCITMEPSISRMI